MTSMNLINLLTERSIHSDIVETLDERSTAALILLCLSKAFDVIDHAMLLNRLEVSFDGREDFIITIKYIYYSAFTS